MVLRQPYRVHATGFGYIDQPKALTKSLLLGHAVPTGELDKKPGVHARPPFSVGVRPPETIGYYIDCDGTGICAHVKSIACPRSPPRDLTGRRRLPYV